MYDNNAGNQPQPNQAMVALRILLALIFLLPGLCGGFFYLASLADWVSRGFSYSGHENYSGAFLIVAVPSIWLSILLLGILLRFATWKAAPKASLILSIIAVAVTAVAGLALLPELGIGNVGDVLMFLLFSLVGLGLAAVPPFLHWQANRSSPQPPEH
jgi:hypothetical protein